MFDLRVRQHAACRSAGLGFGPQAAFTTRAPINPWRSVRGLLMGLAVATLAVLVDARPAESAGAFMPPIRTVAAPAGFNGICKRYAWVCASTSKAQRDLSDGQIIALARQVNRAVNGRVREVSDLAQYRLAEVWALPTAKGGDCEDFALLKKLELIKRGVAPGRLLIATALTEENEAHAVLILRTGQGDLVLDNRTRAIKPWQDTGYSFLRMQNPKSKNRWQMVLAGGMF